MDDCDDGGCVYLQTSATVIEMGEVEVGVTWLAAVLSDDPGIWLGGWMDGWMDRRMVD